MLPTRREASISIFHHWEEIIAVEPSDFKTKPKVISPNPPTKQPRTPPAKPSRSSSQIICAPNRLGFDGSHGSGYTAQDFQFTHFFLANDFPIPHFNKASSADPETLFLFDEAMEDFESKSQWIEAAETKKPIET